MEIISYGENEQGKLSCKKVPPEVPRSGTSTPLQRTLWGKYYRHRKQRHQNSRLRASSMGPFPLRTRASRSDAGRLILRLWQGEAMPRRAEECKPIAAQTKIRPVGLAAELITASCDNNHRLIILTSDPTANRTTPCYLSGNAGGALYPNMDPAPIVGRSERMRGIQRGRNHYAVGFLPL